MGHWYKPVGLNSGLNSSMKCPWTAGNHQNGLFKVRRHTNLSAHFKMMHLTTAQFQDPSNNNMDIKNSQTICCLVSLVNLCMLWFLYLLGYGIYTGLYNW